MKAMKISLVVLTILAAAAYGWLQVRDRLMTDRTPPILSFDSDTLTLSVRDDRSALLTGVRASDDRDGDLSAEVMVRSVSQLIDGSTAKVSYIVFDSSDNMGVASRTLVYSDYESPRFALSEQLIFPVGGSVKLQDRLMATDVLDGDLTDAIRLSTDALNTYLEGSYRINVIVTNSMGDTVTLPLTVQIRTVTSQDPVINLTDQLIYLDLNAAFDPKRYLDSVQETASDAPSRDTSAVEVRSGVSTANAGVYEVYYTYENEQGRTATAILTVVVGA